MGFGPTLCIFFAFETLVCVCTCSTIVIHAQAQIIFVSSPNISTWYLDPKLDLCLPDEPIFHWCFPEIVFHSDFRPASPLLCHYLLSPSSPPPLLLSMLFRLENSLSRSPPPNDHHVSPTSHRATMLPHTRQMLPSRRFVNRRGSLFDFLSNHDHQCQSQVVLFPDLVLFM